MFRDYRKVLISNLISIHDFFTNCKHQTCGAEHNKNKSANSLGNVWKSRSSIYWAVQGVHFKVQTCVLYVH